jgi:transposase-like protein
METIIKAFPVKTRRKFDAAFKLEAVRNWLSSGKSAAVVAAELGLNESLLFSWRKLLPAADGGEGGGGQEARGLRPPVPARGRPARDPSSAGAARHSKKTLGILSEPPSSATNGFTR